MKRSSRYRTLNWMPKSTPMPMNRTANATEIRFSAPTSMKPSAAVAIRPTTVLVNTATMSRPDFSASHSRNSTAATVIAPFTANPSLTVPNSWSFSGIGPVSLTVTPVSGLRGRSATACSISSVAAPPGSSLP